MSILSMAMPKPLKSLSAGYKPKKFHHMVYLDIENVGCSNGFAEKTIKNLRLKELTVSCGKHYSALLDSLKEKCKIQSSFIYPILFDTPEKDKADNHLLQSMNRDGMRFRKQGGVVFVLISNDRELQRKFIDNAINHGVDYKVESTH